MQDRARGQRHPQLAQVAAQECGQLLRVVEVQRPALEARHAATERRVVGGVHLAHQPLHEEAVTTRQPTADDDQAIDQRAHAGHGVAGHDRQLLERSLGGQPVTRSLPQSDLVDLLGRRALRQVGAALTGVHALHASDGDAFLCGPRGHKAVAQTVDLAGGRVVALEQAPVAHHAGAEPGAESDAQQVAVAPRAVGLVQQAVDVGQEAGDGLSQGEEVAVVADEHRQAELVFQRRTKWHAAAKHRQVDEIADDAALVVSRPREGETDRHRLRAAQQPTPRAPARACAPSYARRKPVMSSCRNSSMVPAAAESVTGGTISRPPRTAPKTRFVPPASRVSTTRGSSMYRLGRLSPALAVIDHVACLPHPTTSSRSPPSAA